MWGHHLRTPSATQHLQLAWRPWTATASPRSPMGTARSTTRWIRRACAEALDTLGLGPGDRVLDAGCGAGELLVDLAERHGCGGLGVDTSEILIAEARRRAEAARARRGPGVRRRPRGGDRARRRVRGRLLPRLAPRPRRPGARPRMAARRRRAGRRRRDRGRLLVARRPIRRSSTALGATEDELPSFEGLLGTCTAAGLDPVWVATSSPVGLGALRVDAHLQRRPLGPRAPGRRARGGRARVDRRGTRTAAGTRRGRRRSGSPSSSSGAGRERPDACGDRVARGPVGYVANCVWRCRNGHDPRLSQMSATRSPVTSSKGVVSAGNAHAVSAGLDALERGGNAIDATVAAAFASFVAEPNNAGIAGYGHLAAFTGGDVRDRRPRPSGAARRDPGHVHDGRPRAGGLRLARRSAGDANALGHLAPAVPGAVAGLHAIHARAGRLPWASLLDAAIALADEGLEVTLEPAAAHRGAPRRDPRPARARRDPAARGPPAPRAHRGRAGGAAAPARAGRHAAPRRRARSRRLLPRRRWPRRSPPRSPRAAASSTTGDLETYAPKLLLEQPTRFRDVELVTANDQVGTEALNILDCFPAPWPGQAEHLHLLAEAMGHAFVDNVTYAGDPDHVAAPLAGLASPAFARLRAVGDRAGRAPRRGRWRRPTRGRSRTASRARRRRRRPAGHAARRRSSPPTPTATSSRSSRRSATTSGRRSRCPARASCSTTR